MKIDSFNVLDTPFIKNHDGTVNLVRLIQSNEKNKTSVATMNYAWLEKKGKLKPHRHEDCLEYYFFLNGKGSMSINTEKLFIKPGDFVVVPVNAVHTLENTLEEKLVFLTLRVVCENV